MATLDDLAQRIDRLLMRHAEAMRTQALLEQELAAVTLERDSLKSRLQAARTRIEALLDRLPADGPIADGAGQPTAEVASEHPGTGVTP
jgi:chromosome segregation ATPase